MASTLSLNFKRDSSRLSSLGVTLEGSDNIRGPEDNACLLLQVNDTIMTGRDFTRNMLHCLRQIALSQPVRAEHGRNPFPCRPLGGEHPRGTGGCQFLII